MPTVTDLNSLQTYIENLESDSTASWEVQAIEFVCHQIAAQILDLRLSYVADMVNAGVAPIAQIEDVEEYISSLYIGAEGDKDVTAEISELLSESLAEHFE